MAVNAGTIIYDVEINLQQLASGQREINNRLTQTETRISQFGTALSRIAGLISAALSVREVANYGNAWVEVNNKLVNSVREHEKLADVTDRVFQISQDTRSSLSATAMLYGRLERSTRTAGTSTEDLEKLTETVNKGLIISGASAAEASSTMIQLSQALASGVLRGQEFNSISENGSRIAVALSEALGVTIGELRAMAAEGKLTTDVVVKGLLSQANKIGDEFAKTFITMGQAIEVAGNNLTKYFGESTTVQSSLSVFNSSIITLSENMDYMAAAAVAAGMIFGGRIAGAIALSTRATIADSVAKVNNAKSSALAADAEMRRAQAAKAAAKVELDNAISRAQGARVTATVVTEEMRLAEARIASIRTNISQIESEKALEVQRLRAQITEQGRIASMTRMAQLQQASAALTARLAQAEVASNNARSASAMAASSATAAADAKASAARANLAVATEAANAAAARFVVAQRAASLSSTLFAAAASTLKSALALIGGPVGIITIVAAGWYLYTQRQNEAKQASIEFASTLPDVIAKLRDLNAAQAKGVQADTVTSIKNQKEAIADLKDKIAELNADYDKYNSLAKQFGTTNDENNGYVIKAAEAASELAKARRDLDSKNTLLERSESALKTINVRVNETILEQMKNARDNAVALKEAEVKTLTLAGAQGFLAQKMGLATGEMKKFNAENLKLNWGGEKGEKLIEQAKRRLALSKVEGKERAKLQAQYDAADAGVTGQPEIAALERIYAETEATKQAAKDEKKAASEATKAENKAESENKRRLEQLKDLKDQTEALNLTEQRRYREAAQFEAVAKLGADATAAQIQEAKDSAGMEFDIKQRINDRKAASDENYYAAASLKRQDDLDQTDRQLKAGLITFEQAQAKKAQIAADYQKTIAEATAAQAVTPQQGLQGMVDPVQALANENAKKLALIQQFEQQKVITEQQALALRNAANTEYEKQRTDAMYAMWKSQSDLNNLLGTAFESLQSTASNALTGIVTGTMSAQDAMRSLGTTLLNTVVNGLIQMGVEAVKNFVIGQTMGAAATASAAAQGAATAAAWTPAAIAASIATMGGASGVGFAAYASAQAAGKALSLAGGRKNGGPVTAGSMYQVGEGGMPEIYQAAGKQYMIPGDNGKVISNKDAFGGGAPVVNLNIQNYSSAQIDQRTTQGKDGSVNIDMIVADINMGGKIGQAIATNHDAPRRARN